MRWTSPEKVATLSLSRTSRLAELILMGLSRFWEKPCRALGGPLGAAAVWAAGLVATTGIGEAAWANDTAETDMATMSPAARSFMVLAPREDRCFAFPD